MKYCHNTLSKLLIQLTQGPKWNLFIAELAEISIFQKSPKRCGVFGNFTNLREFNHLVYYSHNKNHIC